MISNERPTPFQHQTYRQPYLQSHAGLPPRPFVQEDTLKSEQIQIERKSFLMSLKENPRGRFLRITEDAGGRHSSIIIPTTGLQDFKRLLDELIKAADELPPAKNLSEAA
ncbi:MAG: PUR family DNA/RNA-binding protein [Verrucomicrobiia bacterium]